MNSQNTIKPIKKHPRDIPWLLNSIDIFGTPFMMTFQRKRAFTAPLGGLLTIAFVAFLITSIIILGSQLVNKDQPRVVNFVNVTPNKTVSFKMPVAISIYDIENQQMDLATSDLFEVYYYMNSSDINNGYELPRKLCEFSDFNITKAEFDENKMGNALCVKDLKTQLTDLNGYWINDFMTFFGIYVGPCVPGLRPGVTCKSLEEIREYLFLHPTAVSIQFQEYAYDPVNYARPISYYIKTNCYMLDPNLYLQIERYSMDFRIETDSGLIFPGWSYATSQELDVEIYIQSDNYDWDSVDQIFIQYIICASNKTNISQRTYLNLSALISQIGGLFNVIMVVSNMSIGIIYQKMMSESIVNVLFDVEKSNKKVNVKLNEIKAFAAHDLFNSKIMKNNKLNELLSNDMQESRAKLQTEKDNILNLNVKSEVNIHKAINPSVGFRSESIRKSIMKSHNFIFEESMLQEYDERLKNQNKNKLSSWNHLVFLLCRCFATKRTLTLSKTVRELDKLSMDFTDVVSIVKNQYDIEKLKYVIFDEIQYAVFNSNGKMANPFVPENIMSAFSKVFIQSKDKKNQKLVLERYLNELDEDAVRNSTIMDKKLLQLWD